MRRPPSSVVAVLGTDCFLADLFSAANALSRVLDALSLLLGALAAPRFHRLSIALALHFRVLAFLA